ncbi:glycoside hydrolase family 93 protein [Clavulina sp. PMI_390]|nr:glycoside hydrolase family 93 protein [Clavulina sp. PMI_390]
MKFALLVSFIAPLAALVSSTPLERRSPLVPTVHDPVNLNPAGGGTYPRIAAVDDYLLSTFTTTKNGTHTLAVTKSTDNGNTWTSLGTIAQGTGDLTNSFLLQLSNGDVFATYRNHDLDSSGAYTYYRITASISTDGGATWKFLSQVDQRAKDGVNGLWEPFARLNSGGDLQVYYAAENSGSDQDILMRSSTDGGSTWGDITTVAGATTTGRDGMPSCTDFNDGSAGVLCVFETTQGTGTFTVKRVVSRDDGVTWGEREQVYVPTGTNNNAGAPFVTTTKAGALVVSFMTDEDTSLHQWVSGANMKILTSNSVDPEVWGDKTTVFPVQASWPSVFGLSGGGVLGCAAHTGAQCSRITFSAS